MPSSPNLYKLLQVDRRADQAVMRYAFRFWSAIYHPLNTETGNKKAFKELTDAWRILSDERQREAYDHELVNEIEAEQPLKNSAFFETMQVAPGAHKFIIRAAYKYLANKYHPDTGGDRDADMYKKITEAWLVIGDGDCHQ